MRSTTSLQQEVRPRRHGSSMSRHLSFFSRFPSMSNDRVSPPKSASAFPLKLVPLDLQLVLDGELVIHQLPLGGEGQLPVLDLHVLELRLLLVLPGHRAGELVAVLLDGQGGLPLLPLTVVSHFHVPTGSALSSRAPARLHSPSTSAAVRIAFMVIAPS